jgi:hypothetical protein
MYFYPKHLLCNLFFLVGEVNVSQFSATSGMYFVIYDLDLHNDRFISHYYYGASAEGLFVRDQCRFNWKQRIELSPLSPQN